MLEFILATGVRNRTTDIVTWLKLSESDPHSGLGFSPGTEPLLGQSLSEIVLYSGALFFCLTHSSLSLSLSLFIELQFIKIFIHLILCRFWSQELKAPGICGLLA